MSWLTDIVNAVEDSIEEVAGPIDDAEGMRTFVLQRDVDVSGVSGTGVVAEGVEFSDGSAVVHWLGEHSSTVVWPSIESVERIHGHGGATRIVFD